MASKIDLAEEDKKYYTAKTNPQIVEFPKLFYLTIEGKGEPVGKTFTEAVQALYPLAYGVKALSKKDGKDFAVAKLEGLWWVKSNKSYIEVPRSEWYWSYCQVFSANFLQPQADLPVVDKGFILNGFHSS